MNLVRVIQKARSALKYKSQPFFNYFFRLFVAYIGNWFWLYDVKKTCEHFVEDRIEIGSVEIE